MPILFKEQGLLRKLALSLLPLLAAVMLVLSFGVRAEESKSNQVVRGEMTQLAGADYWRHVKEGVEGTTTSASPEHGVLISTPGETWFILKEKWMSPAAAVAIFGSISMVVLMYFLVGPLKLSGARTGKKLRRWSRMDRALHWSMAFTFLTLAFSGLMLVYGKHFMKPYVPTELWGWTVYLAKQYHNYMGPIFFILLFAVLFKWWRKSIFNKTDMQWFMKLGGMVGKHKGSHPSAGFSNGGEKAIYWLLIFFGAIAAVSGLILDFPIFGQTRKDMELSNLVHMFSALILICGFVFHIYIGLFGMEGALEGMVTGDVDETWAKEHHDLWYEEMKQGQSGEGAATANEAKPESVKPEQKLT
jgi:formate dehydrogenase subunit gamma